MIDALPKCNFAEPSSVVTAFIAAMNAWELEAWKVQRACRESSDPSAYQSTVIEEVNQVFNMYCTSRERKFGRNGSFQQPPEYDPASESIVDETVDNSQRRAYVTTKRRAVLGDGVYRYTLIEKRGKWLIDNVRFNVDGQWDKHIL